MLLVLPSSFRSNTRAAAATLSSDSPCKAVLVQASDHEHDADAAGRAEEDADVGWVAVKLVLPA